MSQHNSETIHRKVQWKCFISVDLNWCYTALCYIICSTVICYFILVRAPSAVRSHDQGLIMAPGAVYPKLDLSFVAN